MSKRKFASECGLSAATAKRRTRAVPAAAAAVAAPVEPQPSHSAGIPAASAAELVRGSARAQPRQQLLARVLLDAAAHMSTGLAALTTAESLINGGDSSAAAADAALAAAEAALAKTRRRLALTWLLALQWHGCRCCPATSAGPTSEEELSDTCNSSSSCGTAAE